MHISKQTIPWYAVINCGGIESNWNRFESLPEIFPGVSHCQRSAATPNAGCRTYREEGALNPWHLGARYRMGSTQRFSGLLRQIFLRGVGGLNPWHLGARYRTGSHAQIFYGPKRFDFFSRNQRFQRPRAREHCAIRTFAHADRVFIFRGRRGVATGEKSAAKFRVGG